MSFLLRINDVDSLTANGDPICGLVQGGASVAGEIWVRKNGTNFDLGGAKISTDSINWNTNEGVGFSTGVNYLIVSNYDFNPGTDDDALNVWIYKNGSPGRSWGGSAPPPDIQIDSGSDRAHLNECFFVVRENTPNATIDEMRVGTTWADVTPTSEPTVPGSILTTYADITDPVELAFTASGALYAGRDNRGSGGGDTDPVRIHRVEAGGQVVSEIGAYALTDPDAVAVDSLGTASGTPGAVLVGGMAAGGGGYVSAILPDGTIQSVVPQTPLFGDPYRMATDSTGRLLFSDAGSPNVFTVNAGALSVLFTAPANIQGIAVDELDRIFTFGEDGVIRIHGADGTLIEGNFASGLLVTQGALGVSTGGVWGENVFVIDGQMLVRFDSGGSRDEIGTGFRNASDIAFGTDGAMYVSMFERDEILRIVPDSDSDGLGDDVETNTDVYNSPADTGSDPDDPDSDGDGLLDGEEVLTHGTNPNLADSDGDGFDDPFELSTGFDPTSDQSTPDALSWIRTAIEFEFSAANGASYRIEASPDVENWETIETGIPGNGGVISRLYSIKDQPHRFFRARRE